MADATGQSGRVVVRRVLPGSCEQVFTARTDADSMRDWMCPSDGHIAQRLVAHLARLRTP